MILWGEFVKKKTTSQFHCLFCVVVKDFTQWAASELIFLLSLVVNLTLFKLLYVCEATSDIQLSTQGFINKYCATGEKAGEGRQLTN